MREERLVLLRGEEVGEDYLSPQEHQVSSEHHEDPGDEYGQTNGHGNLDDEPQQTGGHDESTKMLYARDRIIGRKKYRVAGRVIRRSLMRRKIIRRRLMSGAGSRRDGHVLRVAFFRRSVPRHGLFCVEDQ